MSAQRIGWQHDVLDGRQSPDQIELLEDEAESAAPDLGQEALRQAGDIAVFEPVLRGWSVLYPRLELTPAVDGLQLATLFFFTVFPYTVATIVPIWRAAITDPDSVMRG